MTMLRNETSKVVEEIRKIPEAMTAAKRAQMAERASQLEKQIQRDQQALKTGESVNYISTVAGPVAVKESKEVVEARLKKIRKSTREPLTLSRWGWRCIQTSGERGC